MSDEIRNGEGGEIPLFQNVKKRVLTLDGAKEFYAEVLEAYAENVINESNLRALVYTMSNYLPYLKFEADLNIEKRLDRIEEKLEGRQ